MVDLYTGTVPNLTQSQPEFDENTQGILDYIAGLAPQLNEWVGVYVQDTTSASTTSNTIGTGSKTFTVEAGKGYKVNMTLRASATSGNFMDGTVTAYSGTSLTVNFTTFTGSGTFSDWNIFLTISGGATLASNTFTGNQFVPDDAYDASGWNGDLSVPTKNAVRDIIESLIDSLTELETSASDSTYASTSSTKAATPQWVLGRVGIIRHGRTTASAAYTPASGESLVRAHGLGAVPKSCKIVLECLVADAGYSIGDIVCPNSYWNGSTAGALNFYADATNCGLKVPSGYFVNLVNKSTGNGQTPTASSWRYFYEYTY